MDLRRIITANVWSMQLSMAHVRRQAEAKLIPPPIIFCEYKESN
jgi:hypothetical protein